MPNGKETQMNYEKPSVTDFGDLVELTQGSAPTGNVDGAAFNAIITVSAILFP